MLPAEFDEELEKFLDRCPPEQRTAEHITTLIQSGLLDHLWSWDTTWNEIVEQLRRG